MTNPPLPSLPDDPNVVFTDDAERSVWVAAYVTSLRTLSSAPERVWFVRGNGECLNAELTRHRAITLQDMISGEATQWVRELLREVAQQTTGSGFRSLASNVTEANRNAEINHFNHDENRDRLLGLIDTFRSAYRPEFLKRLRSGKVDGHEYVAVVSHAVSTVANDELLGLPQGTVSGLFEKRSYTARWLWLRLETVTNWLAKGGIESARPDGLTNGELDSHYVVVGSYCDQLLTRDDRSVEKDQRLRAALQLSGSWNATVWT